MHERIVLAITLLLVAASGCRTSIRYEPRALASSAEAIEIVHQTLESQHRQFAPIEVEVSETKFTMLRSTSSRLFGTSGLNRTVIRFSTIAEMSLSKKNDWFAVTFTGTNGAVLLHVYTPDAASAQRFMDAVDTLRRLATSG